MSAMIEKAARAIYEADDVWSSAFPWPDMGSDDQSADNYRRIARAAIEAMREPTEAMHEAAEEISVYYDDFSCGDGNITLGLSGFRAKFNGIWGQLIDAALKEQP